jgi:hypothetical protein
VRFPVDPEIPLGTKGVEPTLRSVEPRAYVREAALRAVRKPGMVTLARELKSPISVEKSVLDRLLANMQC